MVSRCQMYSTGGLWLCSRHFISIAPLTVMHRALQPVFRFCTHSQYLCVPNEFPTFPLGRNRFESYIKCGIPFLLRVNLNTPAKTKTTQVIITIFASIHLYRNQTICTYINIFQFEIYITDKFDIYPQSNIVDNNSNSK